MKAIFDDEGRLRFGEVADPVPAPDEALIRVRAAGVNRADLAQRAGNYPPPQGASDILGLELAGEVLAAPPGSAFHVGERVCALVTGGGYAQLAAVPDGMLMRIPGELTFEQAAALPEVHLTAYLNLFLEGELKPGERVLVHGGASGVGTAAIQQVREAGAHVATTSSAGKVDRCRALGADPALDRRDPSWPERLRSSWGGVDVILDMVGEDTAAAAFELLDLGGRLVWIASLSGTHVRVDVRTMMRKRLTLKGSTLRNRPLAEKVALREAFERRFSAAIASGRIVPVLHDVLEASEADAAHDALRGNETVGKVVLRMP